MDMTPNNDSEAVTNCPVSSSGVYVAVAQRGNGHGTEIEAFNEGPLGSGDARKEVVTGRVKRYQGQVEQSVESRSSLKNLGSRDLHILVQACIMKKL